MTLLSWPKPKRSEYRWLRHGWYYTSHEEEEKRKHWFKSVAIPLVARKFPAL